MEQHDVERIALAALKDFGLSRPDLTVAAVDGAPGQWKIDIAGSASAQRTLKIRCGQGTTAQYVREQIVNQYTA